MYSVYLIDILQWIFKQGALRENAGNHTGRT